MKTKKIILISSAVIFSFAVLTYGLIDLMIEPPGIRSPASIIPNNYESSLGCEKQAVLWDQVQATKYKDMPEYRELGMLQLIAMSKQELSIKGTHISDFAPDGWKKFLHGRGAIAKIKIVPRNSPYTGIFRGADCGLLRISLTYKTAGSRPVAPGLALKILRDHIHSANISALVSLNGQGKEFNFFKYPMSNIVPIGKDIGQKLVHRMFRKVSNYPEELLANDLASFDAKGVSQAPVVAPRQIFFVPSKNLVFNSEEHDVRDDFSKIPNGTAIYQVYLGSESRKAFDFANYTNEQAAEFLKESTYVADIVTTSDFVASVFGDDGIFFRHQLR